MWTLLCSQPCHQNGSREQWLCLQIDLTKHRQGWQCPAVELTEVFRETISSKLVTKASTGHEKWRRVTLPAVTAMAELKLSNHIRSFIISEILYK